MKRKAQDARLEAQPTVKLPAAPRLFADSVRQLGRHWKVMGGILLVYGVLQILLVRGLGAGVDLQQLKQSLLASSSGGSGQVLTGLALFGVLLGSGGSADQGAGIYQMLLLVLVSLALIWAVRQFQAGSSASVRNAFYKGMYPLVPFILVLLVIGLQLLPLLIGSALYGAAIGGGIAAGTLETVLWTFLFLALGALSFYFVSSSVFALYIVTLPDMTPLKALRSARRLVRRRRWSVIRKLLFLPLVLLLLAAGLIIPLILVVTAAAEAAFFVFSLAALALAHNYLYSLYRALL